MTKGKPLDLEKKIAIEPLDAYIHGVKFTPEQQEVVFKIVEDAEKEIKQRIKKACEFYLRYRNDPYTFFDEFPEKFELFKKESGTNFMPETHYEMLDYNKWLFELVFKFVFEEGEDYD